MYKRSWWIASLLFLSTLLCYFDRQILSLVSPALRADFSLSATRYSLLLDSFLLGYTAFQFLAGMLVDKLGARAGLMIAMLWWSGAGALAATARNPWQLSICLFLMGVGEAANWPSSIKAIQEWFPARQRAVAVGFFNAGSSVGAVIAPLVVSRLTVNYSWRTAFVSSGVLGLLWVGPWMLLYRKSRYTTEGAPNTPRVGATFLADIRAWGIILARVFADSIWFFYIFWLPDYLSHVQSLSLQAIGLTAWIPFVAAAAGNFAGGAMSGYLVHKGKHVVPSRLLVMAAAAVLMSMGTLVRFCHEYQLALALISIAVFAYSAWAANVLTLPSDLFPPAAVATVAGTAGSLGGVGGILTTYLAGRIIDHYSYGPVFIGLGILPFLALGFSLLTMKKPRMVCSNSPCFPQV